MRQIIAITQISLDGVMQAPGGPEEDPRYHFTHGGWAMPFVDSAVNEIVNAIMASEFDLLLGRVTYDIFAGYWPKQDNEIARAFNKATKYVITRRHDRLDWSSTERVGGDVVESLRELKATDGPPLHVWGSGELLQTMIAADLVDEFRLWVIPVVLGEGRHLFEKGLPARKLKLVATQQTPSGVVASTYRLNGSLDA